MCLWARSFFGLPTDKTWLYEQVYDLVEKSGLTYTEVWEMPIAVRQWWVKRKQKDNEPQNPGGPPPPGMRPGGKR